MTNFFGPTEWGDSGLCLPSGGKSNMAGFMGFMVIVHGIFYGIRGGFSWDLMGFYGIYPLVIQGRKIPGLNGVSS